MPKTTFLGHPLHPQLITVPVALFPFSFVMDLLYLGTGRRSYADAAWYSMLGAYAGGMAAGAAGAVDYMAIPKGHKAQKTADTHAILNIGAIGLYTLNLFLRRGRERPSGVLPAVLSGVGVAGLLLSSWYGGHMVYSHGLRVKGVDALKDEPEFALPGDHAMHEGIETIRDRAAQAVGVEYQYDKEKEQQRAAAH